MVIRAVVYCLLLLAGVSFPGADAWAFLDFKPAELEMTPPEWCPDADAIVLDKLFYMQTNITSVRIKIFTEEGKQYGNVHVPAEPQHIKARTITPDGRTIEVKSSQFRKMRQKAAGYTVSFVWGTNIAFPEVTAGCILEYTYQVPRWGYHDRVYFSHEDLPVRYSIIAFTALKTTEFEIIPRNVETYDFAYETKDESLPEGKATRWNGVLAEYVPSKDERFLPPWDYHVPYVYFVFKGEKFLLGKSSGANSWKLALEDLNRDVAEYEAGARKLKRLCDELRTGETDTLAVARKLYHWVRDSLEFIDDRWWYHCGYDAGTYDEVSIGDRVKARQATGAEKVMILHCLYDLAGLQSRPLLVVPANERPADPAMPLLGQFSTMILELKIGSTAYYLDPVFEDTPFNVMSWAYRGAMALPIDAAADTVIVTPLSRTPNLCQVALNCALDETGSLTADGNITLTGEYFLSYYPLLRRADAAERRRLVSQYFLDYVDSTRLQQVDVALDSTRVGICKVTVRFDIPEYAAVLGTELLLPPNCADRLPADLLPHVEARRNDLYFDFPNTRLVTINYTLPAGFEYTGDPINVSEGGAEGLNYFASFGKDSESGRVVYQRSLSRERAFYPVSAYEALREYFNILAKHDGLAVAINHQP